MGFFGSRKIHANKIGDNKEFKVVNYNIDIDEISTEKEAASSNVANVFDRINDEGHTSDKQTSETER